MKPAESANCEAASDISIDLETSIISASTTSLYLDKTDISDSDTATLYFTVYVC